MSSTTIRVSEQVLRAFVAGLFQSAGCSRDDAKTVADCLVQTNLWGIDSHGVLRAPKYLERVRSGAVNARPEIRHVATETGVQVIHADNALGFVGASAGMAKAVELARQSNIAAVGVIGSNHCGATALYARMALEHDMIGIAMSSVAPNMVMTGGSEPITGNNPIAVAVPTFGEFPFVLDISMSAVAGGKLLVAAKNGEEIPLGWATDKDGRPTTDPRIGFDGYLMPLGGHKGYGLSLLVDILSGVITGGHFQHTLKSMYRYPDDPSNTAHQMIVINPLALLSRDALKVRMEEFLATLKNAPMWDPDAEMLLPGELEHRSEQERRSNGIPLPEKVFAELRDLGTQLNLQLSLHAMAA